MQVKNVSPSKLLAGDQPEILEYLYRKPFDSSPVLIRLAFNSRLKRLFVGMASDGSTPVGHAFIDFSSLHVTRLIIRGDDGFKDHILGTLELDTPLVIEYIPEDEVPYFSARFHVEPSGDYLLLRHGGVRAETVQEMAWQAGKSIERRRFADLPLESIIQAYGFEVSTSTRHIFQDLDGDCLLVDGKIGGLVYDNFSALKNPPMACLLAGVLVKKEYRNRGFCKLLLARFISRVLEENPGKQVGLFVSRANERALKCYGEVGFFHDTTYYRLVS